MQKQRAQDVERVKQNIVAETKLGETQQRHIRRIRQARLRQDAGDDVGELVMEAKVWQTLFSPVTVGSIEVALSGARQRTPTQDAHRGDSST